MFSQIAGHLIIAEQCACEPVGSAVTRQLGTCAAVCDCICYYSMLIIVILSLPSFYKINHAKGWKSFVREKKILLKNLTDDLILLMI